VRRGFLLGGQAGDPAPPGQLPHDLPVGAAEVRVALQPAGALLLVAPELPLAVGGAVGLLLGQRQRAALLGRRLVVPPQAKHACGALAVGVLLTVTRPLHKG
jgi:hypothetical protein